MRFRSTLIPVFALPLSLALLGRGFWGPVLMLGGLIFLHELGHFLVAKWMKLPVETFSLGFGPRLIGFKWHETDVRLSALPLGGYVKLAGYNPEEPEAEDPYGFLQQPAWKRILFYSGGILANVATTFVLLGLLGIAQVRVTKVSALPSPLLVAEVVPGMAAAQGGLQAGDQILRMDELAFPGAKSDDAVTHIQGRPGQTLSLSLLREGKPLELQLRVGEEAGKGKLGIQFGHTALSYERRAFRFTDLGAGLKVASVGSVELGGQVLVGLKKLVTRQASLKQVGGPIAIAKAGSDAAKAGWERFLFLCAFLSMNLAVLNALPIPFLDGGHIAILCFEKLRRKDLSIALKEKILTGGFILLVGLMAFVIVLDLWRLKH